MKLYLAKITPLLDPAFFEASLSFVPKERQDAIQKIHYKEDQARSLAAGLLLEYGLRERGYTLLEKEQGKQKVSLVYGEDGKPELFGDKLSGDSMSPDNSIFFNLTHSGDYAAAAFDAMPLGVDLEKVRDLGQHENSKKLAARFFCKREQEFLETVEARDGVAAYEVAFIKLWTRKESYVKAKGTGIRMPFDSFCVLEPQTEDQAFFFHTVTPDDRAYQLSVCGGRKEMPEIATLDLTDFGKTIIIKTCEGGEIHV